MHVLCFRHPCAGGTANLLIASVRSVQVSQGAHADHFPGPAGHTVPDTGQDAIGLLGHLGTLLAHVQLPLNQNLQVPFCLSALQLLHPQPLELHGVVISKVQDPALGLVEPHTTEFSPSIQPVQVPLQSPPAFQQIDTPPYLVSSANGGLNPLIHIITKDIKQGWAQH
ncbi:hypothetical protein WISP_111202 [Willisornis vidua]|uniref:Uncharacterized protein n=1 Tax=Willisornis vidua TaxID=1566151 RepID=A0ABQ9D0P1_9PASS|nr:hypothetical protein WISP_111202 [Willisornis vidua]